MADNPSELSSSVPREGPASLVAGVKAFLVWLGGSLASITAMFFATGYLITRAHLSMLGLHGVLDFDNHYIVQESGKFFLVVGYSTVSNVALPLLAVLGPAVIAAMVVRHLLGSRAQRWHALLRSRLPGFGAGGWMRLPRLRCIVSPYRCTVFDAAPCPEGFVRRSKLARPYFSSLIV